jgi:broad specificity phosphatase PhoE
VKCQSPAALKINLINFKKNLLEGMNRGRRIVLFIALINGISAFLVPSIPARKTAYSYVHDMRLRADLICSAVKNNRVGLQMGNSAQDADFSSVPLRPSSVPKLALLGNRYFGLRHGESFGNVQNVISSHPVQGTLIHGLTEKGKDQAKSAAPHLVQAIGGPDQIEDLVILTSNFTRARETAAEVAKALSTIHAGSPKDIVIELSLRERWFGELDNTIITNYNKVWPADLKDASCSSYGVESVDDVCERLRTMMLRLETTYSNRNVVLVSHADTLQILQTYIAGVDPRTFSQFRFKNGEVRALLQDPRSLPQPAPLTYSRTNP